MKIIAKDIKEYGGIVTNFNKFVEVVDLFEKEPKNPLRRINVEFVLTVDVVGEAEYRKQLMDVDSQKLVHKTFVEVCKYVLENTNNIYVVRDGVLGILKGVSSDTEDFYYVFNLLEQQYETDNEVSFKVTKKTVWVSCVGHLTPFDCIKNINVE